MPGVPVQRRRKPGKYLLPPSRLTPGGTISIRAVVGGRTVPCEGCASQVTVPDLRPARGRSLSACRRNRTTASFRMILTSGKKWSVMTLCGVITDHLYLRRAEKFQPWASFVRIFVEIYSMIRTNIIRPKIKLPTMDQRRLFRHCTSEAPMPPAPTIPRVVASFMLMSKR